MRIPVKEEPSHSGSLEKIPHAEFLPIIGKGDKHAVAPVLGDEFLELLYLGKIGGVAFIIDVAA